MRIATAQDGDAQVVAIEHDQKYYRWNEVFPDRRVRDVNELIRSQAGMPVSLDAARFDRITPIVDDVTLAAPIPNPVRNIMCVGKNYLEHAAEFDRSIGRAPGGQSEVPIIFTKATTAICGPSEDIVIDPDISTQIDYEAELAVIVGRTCRNLAADDVDDAIFGYTVVNDITARDIQHRHQQWFLGKSLDRATAMGPVIVTSDEMDPRSLAIQSTVNGELRQSSNTSLMMTSITELMVIMTRIMTLIPGDIVATGTPAGVGIGFDPPKYLVDGDRVSCTVDGIGSISNLVRFTGR